ncbi:GNAT family N-acetyltransferase [Methanocella arvoryzae]|nr:GNAT family N-acetyltransferase [Methanocella arvoryzae]
MVVKLIDNKDLWDKHMDESAYGTLFHKWDFLRIIEKCSGYRLYPYGIYRGDELVCLFPVFARSAMGWVTIASPPPNMAIPYLGLVMSPIYDKLRQRKKESYLNHVVEEMEAEIKKLHAGSISITTVNGFVDMRPFKWSGYHVQMQYSYAVSLKQPADEILNRFDGKLKGLIAEAEKLPLSIVPADDDMGGFCKALASHYRRSGTPKAAPSPEFLKEVISAFPDNVKICYLRNGDQIAAPIVYYQYKGRFSFWLGWGISDSGLRNDAYVAWSFIRSKQAEGLATLELPGSGQRELCYFKSMFNAPLEYHFSIRKSDLLGSIAGSLRHGAAVS